VFLQAPGSNSATAGQEEGGDAGAADQQVGINCQMAAAAIATSINQSITRFSSKRGTQKGSHSQTTFGGS
jgi:hypothetical protein